MSAAPPRRPRPPHGRSGAGERRRFQYPAKAKAPPPPPPPPGALVRAAAARVLDASLERGRSLTSALAKELPAIADSRDRALLEAICYETARRLRRYRALRDGLLEKPLPAQARPVGALLLAGLAQLDGLEMAPYAAISATAEAARLLERPHLVALVNGVLRRFDRERATRTAAVDAAASAHHEHPDWLRDTLRADWGDAAAATVLEANNHPAPLWLRVNRSRGSRDAYLARLHDAGIEASAPEALPDALQLAQPMAPTTLPGWQQGDVSVQDGAAQLVLQVLAPGAGERVLDACAAPGGKAAYLLEAQPSLQLLAIDSDGERMGRVRSGLDRLGLQASLRTADATTPAAWWDGRPVPRILIDAPCSGTGVIRRHPDIKWHRREGDIAPLVALQASLLDALWPMLAADGRLVYATCSVLKDENERQIDAFLARHPDARAVALALPAGRRSGAGWQLLPGEQDMDGFFYAALVHAPTDRAVRA